MVTCTSYKLHLYAGEERFVEYVRVDKTSTTPFSVETGDVSILHIGCEYYLVKRCYHPLTPLIVVPTSKELSMFETCLSKYDKCNDGFTNTNYVTVQWKNFKNSKHIDEYYCVLFAILDENIPSQDLNEMKEFFNYYGNTSPCVAWVFKEGMQFKLSHSIKDHHMLFKYKNKEMKKAKRLLQAVQWLEETHNTKMQDEVVKKFNQFDLNKSGSIDKEELEKLMILLGQKLTPEQLDEAYESLDMNKDGVIDLNEFARWFFTGMKCYSDTNKSLIKAGGISVSMMD